jgi:hypothetical protein
VLPFPAMERRKLAALAVAVLTAVVFVGTLGALPSFGEVSLPAFGIALLGLWAVGTVAFGRRS